MPMLAFNNASDPATPDDVRINSSAVKFVEASRPEQNGRTMVYLVGQGVAGIPVVESVDEVVCAVGGLAAASRHYLAGAPAGSPSTVYIAAANISHARPNKQSNPAFWYLCFVDGYELRVLDPLPVAL